MPSKDAMSFVVTPAKAGRDAGPPLPEHSLARLTGPVSGDDGRLFPEGSVGAVVGIWHGGEAYEIEFQRPFHAVVTVAAARLMPV